MVRRMVVDLALVDSCVKCFAGWWADTLVALLPAVNTGIFYVFVKKIESTTIRRTLYIL